MILPFDQEAQFRAAQPTFGRSCAHVFFQRGLIAENDQEHVADVLAQLADTPELAVAELAKRKLIARQNRSAAVEFMKRVVRRIQLDAERRSGGDVGRNRAGSRARTYRVLKNHSLLTGDHLTTLVTRLVGGADKSAS